MGEREYSSCCMQLSISSTVHKIWKSRNVLNTEHKHKHKQHSCGKLQWLGGHRFRSCILLTPPLGALIAPSTHATLNTPPPPPPLPLSSHRGPSEVVWAVQAHRLLAAAPLLRARQCPAQVLHRLRGRHRVSVGPRGRLQAPLSVFQGDA